MLLFDVIVDIVSDFEIGFCIGGLDEELKIVGIAVDSRMNLFDAVVRDVLEGLDRKSVV